MKRPLFNESFYDYQTVMTQSSVQKLQSVDRTKFLDGSYQQKIEEFIDSAVFKVATLHPEDRKGKRRTEKRHTRDYGQSREVEVHVVDVTIPFSGDRSSFSYAPSSRTILSDQADVLANALVVTFYDDDSLEGKCNDFIRIVYETLVRLDSEMSGYRSQIRSTLDMVAARRIEQVKQQSDLDKTRSFPID